MAKFAVIALLALTVLLLTRLAKRQHRDLRKSRRRILDRLRNDE